MTETKKVKTFDKNRVDKKRITNRMDFILKQVIKIFPYIIIPITVYAIFLLIYIVTGCEDENLSFTNSFKIPSVIVISAYVIFVIANLDSVKRYSQQQYNKLGGFRSACSGCGLTVISWFLGMVLMLLTHNLVTSYLSPTANLSTIDLGTEMPNNINMRIGHIDLDSFVYVITYRDERPNTGRSKANYEEHCAEVYRPVMGRCDVWVLVYKSLLKVPDGDYRVKDSLRNSFDNEVLQYATSIQLTEESRYKRNAYFPFEEMKSSYIKQYPLNDKFPSKENIIVLESEHSESAQMNNPKSVVRSN